MIALVEELIPVHQSCGVMCCRGELDPSEIDSSWCRVLSRTVWMCVKLTAMVEVSCRGDLHVTILGSGSGSFCSLV